VSDVCPDLAAQEGQHGEATQTIPGHAADADGRRQDALRKLTVFDRGDDVKLGQEPKLTHELPDVRFVACLRSTELVGVEE
jgi:hypothetical protein